MSSRAAAKAARRATEAAARRRIARRRALTREAAVGADHTPAFYLRRGAGRMTPVKSAALTADAFQTALERSLRAG